MSGFNFGNTGQQSVPAFGAQASQPQSSGFSFGSPAQPNAAANVSFGTPKPSGFNFGSPAAVTSTPSSGFGMPSQQPSSGFNFGGTPTATVQPQQQQQSSGGLSFGAAQPQQQQPTSGLSFGAAQPQQQSMGMSFGAQQANPAASFGAQPAPSFGAQPATSFGAQPAVSFGAQAAPSFGTQSAPSFGAPQTTIPTNTVQPLSTSFATPAAQPQTTGFGFGQQSAPAATTTSAAALSFSLPTSTAQASTTGFSFGQQQQGQAAVSSAPSLSFGQPILTTTSSAAPTLTLNPLTTTTPSMGLSFGQPPSQAPPAFGVSQTQQQQSSLLSSLASQPLGTTSIAATPISNATQSVGLGGIDMNTTQPKAVEGKSESTKVKETQVPKEIIQTIDDFKAYMKQQKTLSSDIIRTTDRKLKSVTDEIKRLNCNVQEISNDVDNNKLSIKLLRSDTSKIIQHADMAQRTHETPSGLQFENVMPQIYFNELINKYENDLLTLKHQVELTEKHLQTLSNPQNFSAQELKQGLRQIHESFIALAGRLQETHTKVDGQKEQFLNLRKFMLRDSTNVFEVEPESQAIGSSSNVQFGPNPFTSSMHSGAFNILNQSFAKQQQWPAQQMQPQNTSFFGNSSFGFNKKM